MTLIGLLVNTCLQNNPKKIPGGLFPGIFGGLVVWLFDPQNLTAGEQPGKRQFLALFQFFTDQIFV